jgi:hypothetical protein
LLFAITKADVNMKKIKISLAMLGILIGSITSFAFKPNQMDTPCKTGPAQFVSQCNDTNQVLCCETEEGLIFNGPLK